MTEREKMECGLWHDANFDTELLKMREQAEDLCFDLNQTRPSDTEKREKILRQLLPHRGADTVILSPFYTDYGTKCRIGEGTFINHNAYLMDGGGISIGLMLHVRVFGAVSRPSPFPVPSPFIQYVFSVSFSETTIS